MLTRSNYSKLSHLLSTEAHILYSTALVTFNHYALGLGSMLFYQSVKSSFDISRNMKCKINLSYLQTGAHSSTDIQQ